MPGVLGSVAVLAAAAILDDIVDFAEVDELVETGDALLGKGSGDGSGVATVDAWRRYSAILSLYASVRDSTDSWPSLQSIKIDRSALINFIS